jgi:hypothetical protein
MAQVDDMGTRIDELERGVASVVDTSAGSQQQKS